MRKQKTFRTSPFLWPLLGSLAVHCIFLLTSPWFFPYPEAESSLLDTPAKVYLEPVQEPEGRLVDILDNRPSEETAPTTDYLSDKNRRVDKETQARNTSLQPDRGQMDFSGQTSKAQSSQDRSAEFGESKASSLKPDLSIPQDFLSRETDKAMAKRSSPSNYLPEVDIGSETLLNTREFAYQSFYIRMKRQMEGEWRVRSLMMSQPRTKDQLVAEVNIVLSEKGEVLSVDLKKSSGNPRYDREAIRTAREAGPYLNPPDGLVNEYGKIVIPQWGFIFSYVTVF